MVEEDMVKITVVIAGRPYPLQVREADEAPIRRIVKALNDKITELTAAYEGRDKQDILSMTMLAYAYEQYKLRKQATEEGEAQVLVQLDYIDNLLSQMI